MLTPAKDRVKGWLTFRNKINLYDRGFEKKLREMKNQFEYAKLEIEDSKYI